MGRCNSGHLPHPITGLTAAEIPESAMAREGDWEEQANRYCPTSGLLIDTVPAEMFDLGLTRDDMRHLERSPIRASCGAATSRIFASRTATTRCATCAHGWKT